MTIFAAVGHVDHGKTALVKALTGINTDTLLEEKQRGITIKSGYAPLGNGAIIIDMPGHEALVKNMALTASGVNCAIVCIDAREGVMPQTLQHVKILQLLNVQKLIIVFTKCDLAQNELLIASKKQAEKLVNNALYKDAVYFEVSAKTGQGIDLLRDFLKSITAERKAVYGSFYMSVDRVFTKHGVGTIAGGSVFQGKVKKGDTVYIYPKAIKATVKRAESGGLEYDEISDGRAALNLSCKLSDVKDGDIICSKGKIVFKRAICIKLIEGDGLNSGDIAQLVLGAKSYTVRITTFGEYAYVKADTPILACYKQRLLLIKSNGAIYGGEVLVCMPKNETRFDKREKERLAAYVNSIDEGLLYEINTQGEDEAENCFFFLEEQRLNELLIQHTLKSNEESFIKDKQALTDLVFQMDLTPPYINEAADVLKLSTNRAERCAQELCKESKFVLLKTGMYISCVAFDKMKLATDKLIVNNNGATLAALRDELFISRKYAKAFLEYCDKEGIYSNINNVRFKREP